MNDRLRELSPEVTAKDLHGRWRKVEGATLRHAHKFLVRRWRNLREVRRHAVGWLLFVLVLTMAVIWQSNHLMALYSQPIPAEGQVYTEGVTGKLENLNPIYASTPAERAASHLLFARLLTYDDQNQLVGDLATSWTADESGKVYTLVLRQDAKWHDNAPVTAKDVLFTFDLIKNADAKSPLYSSWRNITIEQVDDYTLRFTLPGVYAPFLNSLVQGILPQHILGQVRPIELRSHAFNRRPIGSGPFAFQDLAAMDSRGEHSLIRMSANQSYFGGAPKLNRFHLHAYADSEQLVRAQHGQEVAAVADSAGQELMKLSKDDQAQVTQSPLLNAVYAFLKTNSPVLGDQKVRLALEQATDTAAVQNKVGNKIDPLGGPLLPGQVGHASTIRQPAPNFARAEQLLDDAGWRKGPDGKRSKDGQPLRLQLATLSTGDYPTVAKELLAQWSKLGISFDSQLVSPETIQQNVIVPRAYDILIYELAIGHDPDTYAYWHSSQATERGFNLSNYKSGRADDALVSARSRLEPELRAAKYRAFAETWVADVPAVALYQSALVYAQNDQVTSFVPHSLSERSDRYYNVIYWSAGLDDGRPTR